MKRTISLISLLLVMMYLAQSGVTAAQRESLTTTYTAPDNSFSLRHPDLWIVISEEEGIVTFADSYAAEFLYTQRSDLESGQLILSIVAPSLVKEGYGDSLDEVAAVLDAGLAEQGSQHEVSDVRIGGRPGKSLQPANNGAVGIYVFTTSEDEIGIALLITAPSEVAQAEARVFRVLSTMTSTSFIDLMMEGDAQTLSQTYESEANGIAFDYPAGWSVDEESYAPSIVLSSRRSDPQYYGDNRVLGSLMSVTRPSWISPELENDAPIEEVLAADAEQDEDFIRPRIQRIEDEQFEIAFAYENILTFGEITVFMVRMPNNYLLKLRVHTADGELPDFFATIINVVKSVHVTDISLFPSVESEESTNSNAAAGSAITPDTANQIVLIEEFNVSGDSFSGNVLGIDVSPDDTILAVALEEQVYLIDIESGDIVWELHPDETVFNVDFSPDGNYVAIGIDHNRILMWDFKADTTSQFFTRSRFRFPVKHLMFNHDGTRIGVYADFSPPAVYNAETGARIIEFEDGELLALSPDSSIYAATYTLLSIGEIRTYDAETGDVLKNMTLPDNQLANDLTFSPDGSIIAVGYSGLDGGKDEVQFWNVQTGRLSHRTSFTNRFPATGTFDSIQTIEFSPDGTVLASGTEGGTVWLWNAATGQPIAKLEHHSLRVNDLAFRSDGGLLFAGSNDGTISVGVLNSRKKLEVRMHSALQ